MTTLYLSRMLLATRNRDVRADLSDCHALHRRLLLAFPNLGGLSAARDHFGILYRLDSGDGGARLLVQSSAEPDWSRLPTAYLLDPHPLVKRIDSLYDTLVTGQKLRFCLRANPTRRISDRGATQPERWRGKRVDLRNEEDQLAWLTRKGEQAGFQLLSVHTQPNVVGFHSDRPIADVRTSGVNDRVIGRHPAGRLTFASVTFEGRLRITDPAAFREALTNGIGSGKAFGFGLLSIAPA